MPVTQSLNMPELFMLAALNVRSLTRNLVCNDDKPYRAYWGKQYIYNYFQLYDRFPSAAIFKHSHPMPGLSRPEDMQHKLETGRKIRNVYQCIINST